MCTTFSHTFKNITQNGQNHSCDTIVLKRRNVEKKLQNLLAISSESQRSSSLSFVSAIWLSHFLLLDKIEFIVFQVFLESFLQFSNFLQ